MSSCWDGEACEEYLRRLRSKIDNLQAISERIQTLIDYCRKTIERVKEADRKERERIKRIQETVAVVDAIVTAYTAVTNPGGFIAGIIKGVFKKK